MTDLVVCIGAGKGTWSGVLRLINSGKFSNIFLVLNQWTFDNLKLQKDGLNFVLVNSDEKTIMIRDSIISQLKGKIRDFEVAVNIDSGTGKEHAGLITALLKLGLAFRFISAEGDKIEDLTADEKDYFESNSL
jgi:hypothetical protein